MKNKLYQHNIQTIEYTKLLDIPCDTLTFSQPLRVGFPEKATQVTKNKDYYYLTDARFPEDTLAEGKPLNVQLISGVGLPKLTTPMGVGNTAIFPSVLSFLEVITYINSDSGVSIPAKYNSATTKLIFPDGTSIESGDGNKILSTKITQSGEYMVQFILNYKMLNDATGNNITYIVEYNLSAVNLDTTKVIKGKTIAEVLKRILSVGESRRANDPPRFVLDKAIAEKFKSVSAPEFFITRNTMFEALLQVGKYIHGIPVLLFPTDELKAEYGNNIEGVVTFDFLGGTNEPYEIKGTLVADLCSYSSDEYCGAIDSIAENLVNTISPAEGSITYPFFDGSQTTRCAEGSVKIGNDTAFLGIFDPPIYKAIKLELGDANGAWADATPFLYEQTEYNNLYDYSGYAYPNTKAYAIAYTIGGNCITELEHKIEKSSSLSTAYGKPAIENICAALGLTCPTYYKDLKFRFTYIPSSSVRVRQFHPYTTHPARLVRLNNQSANSAESSFFGENLKGLIARMGLPIITRTYDFIHLKDIPKKGDLVLVDIGDGNGLTEMYVVSRTRLFEPSYIRTTLTLTPYFNRLNEYFSLNSNIRMYDVSERQITDRHINHCEFAVIGNKPSNGTDGAPILANANAIHTKAINVFASMFSESAHWQDNKFGTQVSFAVAQGFTKDGTPLTKCCLPCTSSAIGNSLSFSFRYFDNYCAGFKARDISDTEISDKDSVYLQNAVAYGDQFGEIEKLTISLGDTPSGADAKLLPEFNGSIPSENLYFDLGAGDPLIVEKDGRERLLINYQLQFVSNKRSIVLGPQLALMNPLVTKVDPENYKPKFYYLTKRLNMLNKYPDLTDAYEFSPAQLSILFTNGYISVSEDNSDKCFKISIPRNVGETYKEKTYAAWALINSVNGELIIGENGPFEHNAQPDDVYFTFLDYPAFRRLPLI